VKRSKPIPYGISGCALDVFPQRSAGNLADGALLLLRTRFECFVHSGLHSWGDADSAKPREECLP
jgi:hypothetical protein